MTDLREATQDDWQWLLAESEPIGGAQIVSNGVLHTLSDYDAIIAYSGDQRTGFAVYRLDLPKAELLAIRAVTQWSGVGTQLIRNVEERVKAKGAQTLWLCTTNDNISAIQFYQRRGYRFRALHTGEFQNVLKIKSIDPDTPVVGQNGIVIRDELVFEKVL